MDVFRKLYYRAHGTHEGPSSRSDDYVRRLCNGKGQLVILGVSSTNACDSGRHGG